MRPVVEVRRVDHAPLVQSQWSGVSRERKAAEVVNDREERGSVDPDGRSAKSQEAVGSDEMWQSGCSETARVRSHGNRRNVFAKRLLLFTTEKADLGKIRNWISNWCSAHVWTSDSENLTLNFYRHGFTKDCK